MASASRLSNAERKERGIARISQLIAEGYTSKDIIDILKDEEGVTERTIRRWISCAKRHECEIVALIDTTNLDESRWATVRECKQQEKIYRALAKDERDGKNTSKACSAERVAIDYTKLIADLVHWRATSPERSLGQPEIRALALRELFRGLKFMTAHELSQLRDRLSTECEARLEGTADTTFVDEQAYDEFVQELSDDDPEEYDEVC